MTEPENNRLRWMAQYVQCLQDRSTLCEGEQVEIYVPQHCIGRFRDAQINAAMAGWRKRIGEWEKNGNGDDRTRPLLVIHCGRFWIVEMQTLTTVRPESRPAPVKPKRPAEQLALAWE